MKYIEDFEYHKMWETTDVCWHGIHPDVNILVGINGRGKTTLLNAINDYYNNTLPKSFNKGFDGNRIVATTVDSPVLYIQSFDVPSNVKKKNNSPLYETLMQKVLQNGKTPSFFDYRMRALNFPEESGTINARIADFFRHVDSFFAQTGKHIEIDKELNTLVFIDEDNHNITIDLLSAGEKQLLLILLTIFLRCEEHTILLMDEPELSLHIEWQDKLVSTIREMNPNCQIILTTHSPSIFANGWEDHLVFMDDILKKG